MKLRWSGLLLAALLFATSAFAAGELKPITPRPAPELALTDLDGKKQDLKDYRGKVVLVNFWATWCPPCRAEMPSMQRLKNLMDGQPFVILAVDMAEPEHEIRRFLKEMKDAKIDFPIPLDKSGQTMKAWKVHVFPTSFIVDTEGQLRYGIAGSIEWDEYTPVAAIKSLLPAPAVEAAK